MPTDETGIDETGIDETGAGPLAAWIGRRTFLALGLALAVPSAAFAADPAAALLALINGLRAEHGLGSLRADARLDAAARRHALDMARHDRLDHAGSDGSTPRMRARAAGYDGALPGEVIAASPDGPPGILALWSESAPHRAILLAPGATEAGIGHAVNRASRYGAYWVALLNPVVLSGP